MSNEFTPPEQILFDQELRRYGRAVPFLPFAIVTIGGMTYSVTASIEIGLSPDAVVLVPPGTGMQVIRRAHITAIHVREP